MVIKFFGTFHVSESRRNQTNQLYTGTEKVNKIDDARHYVFEIALIYFLKLEIYLKLTSYRNHPFSERSNMNHLNYRFLGKFIFLKTIIKKIELR